MEDMTLLLNIVWTMVSAFLVFFMQAGFAAVEAGFTRAKNSNNIVMKNLMDFSLGTTFFFIVGFALMFGKDFNGLVGISGFLNPEALADENGMFNGLPLGVFLIFQTVFCATAATIVSGAVAERTKFTTYLVFSAAISILIYPITGHWIWGGGWLSNIGFHDFAGSTAVHSVGGWCALIGAIMVGPRIGKFNKKGEPQAIPGHNIPLGALGVFILWFCWFGFNCGSTQAATASVGDIAITTNLAAATATFATLITTWIRYGKPDVSITFNGSLAGLVAITAGCDTVSYWGSFIIGIIAGVAVVFLLEFFERVLKVDDPVGATSVHLGCGVLGTLLVGLFSNNADVAGLGLFYGGGVDLLLKQLAGVAAVGAYTLVMALIIFGVLKKTMGLRVKDKEQEDGLDIHEHGSSAYADFQIK